MAIENNPFDFIVAEPKREVNFRVCQVFWQDLSIVRAVTGWLTRVFEMPLLYLSGTGPLIKDSARNHFYLIRVCRAL